ncbi:hypothetical protein [Mycolicibacterium obuense]|uniref:Secreted protein n=1 Tax=Mycolicibacterium obuense TaxID=1807 RepID=A0A0J6W889_9MYCO|nr:hypothetical protein [Mycolicibacterium obuense]KMO79455.1 hypothetical protein MOBUDSM44075_01256 [Mycolicibacterium obuense]
MKGLLALAGGLLVAPVLGLGAGNATASPGACDNAACVPYVDRGVHVGGECNQTTRYNFGLDASGNTLACGSKRMWVSFPPLVGVKLLRSPCGDATGVAQSPDGVPLKCAGGAWSADYSVMFYG